MRIVSTRRCSGLIVGALALAVSLLAVGPAAGADPSFLRGVERDHHRRDDGTEQR